MFDGFWHPSTCVRPINHQTTLQGFVAGEAFKIVEVRAFLSPFPDPRAIGWDGTLTPGSMADHLEYPIEARTSAAESVKRDNRIHVVETRLALVRLIQIEPAIAQKLLNRILVLLMAHELGPRSLGVKAVEAKHVHDAERCHGSYHDNATPYVAAY